MWRNRPSAARSRCAAPEIENVFRLGDDRAYVRGGTASSSAHNCSSAALTNIQTGIAPFFLRHEEFIAGNEQTPPLRGPAQMTPRLRFVHAYHYEFPLGPGKALGGGLSGLAGHLAGCWALSGNLDFTTGVPNWVTRNDTSRVALSVAMPNRICDPREVRREGHPGLYGRGRTARAAVRVVRLLEPHAVGTGYQRHGAVGQHQCGPFLSTRAPRQVQVSLQYHF